MTLWTLVGWIGAALVLGAYALATLRPRTPMHVLHVCNAVGAAALAATAAHSHVWSVAALNTVWGCIALQAMRARKGDK